MSKLRVTLTAGPVKVERHERAAAALDELLHRAVARADGRRVVLFIDEVTVLARNLERQEPGTGDNFLHTLRRFRQDHGGRVATVLSGSIGFHHVSTDAPSTVNDIRKITVGPIRDDHATYLAECLLLGVRVNPADAHLVAPAIATAAENVPYYIQHLVSALVTAGRNQGALPGRIRSTTWWPLPSAIPPIRGTSGTTATGWPTTTGPTPTGSPSCSTSTPTPHIRSASTRPLPCCAAREARSTTATRLVSFIERLELDHYLVRRDDEDRFSSKLIQRAWRAMRR